jgi:hypothetical protein
MYCFNPMCYHCAFTSTHLTDFKNHYFFISIIGIAVSTCIIVTAGVCYDLAYNLKCAHIAHVRHVHVKFPFTARSIEHGKEFGIKLNMEKFISKL